MTEEPHTVPAVYWTISKVGGHTIVLWPQHLPHEERIKAAVFNAYRKGGYHITRIEHFGNGIKKSYQV